MLRQIVVHSVEKSEVGSFGRVWNERHYGVLNVVVNGFKHSVGKKNAEFFPLFIDVGITATREINPFKRAFLVVKLLQNLVSRDSAVFFDNYRCTWSQLIDCLKRHIHGCLNHWAF